MNQRKEVSLYISLTEVYRLLITLFWSWVCSYQFNWRILNLIHYHNSLFSSTLSMILFLGLLISVLDGVCASKMVGQTLRHLYQSILCHAYIVEYISNKNIRMYSLINLNIEQDTILDNGNKQEKSQLYTWLIPFLDSLICLFSMLIPSIDPSYPMKYYLWTNDKK